MKQSAGLNQHRSPSIDGDHISQPAAVAMLNVSVPSVQRAKAIMTHGIDESQRAMVAAKLANLDVGGDGGKTNTSIDVLKISQPAAAAMLNVSVPSVQRAKAIMTHGIDES